MKKIYLSVDLARDVPLLPPIVLSFYSSVKQELIFLQIQPFLSLFKLFMVSVELISARNLLKEVQIFGCHGYHHLITT